MIEVYIIEEMERRRRQKEERQRDRVWIQEPEPLPDEIPAEPEERESPRVIVIDL